LTENLFDPRLCIHLCTHPRGDRARKSDQGPDGGRSAGFDFVFIDTEHSPITIDQLQIVLIALRSSPSTTFVRPVANDAGLIKQILDLGAEGVIVPEIHDAATAAAAVAATRYPPAGRRGFGPRRAARLDGGRASYLRGADQEVAAFVMIEHPEAVADIDAILATPWPGRDHGRPGRPRRRPGPPARARPSPAGSDHRAGIRRLRAARVPVRNLRGGRGQRPQLGRSRGSVRDDRLRRSVPRPGADPLPRPGR